MIQLHFVAPQTPAWQNWRQEVMTELAALTAKGPPYAVKDALYKKQRESIFACYWNKCVYCEGYYRLTAKEGDVEHYRPKGRIRDNSKKIVRVDVGGKKQNHPGYWWLAYEPANLLPACAYCNRTGKLDFFPLEPGSNYALSPGEEAQEKPTLVHPEIDNPDEHLKFDPSLGVLAPLTTRGEKTIETFDLNRETLLEARLGAYHKVAMSIHQTALLEPGLGVSLPATLSYLHKHKIGEAAYSIAGRRAIEDFREPMLKLIDRMKELLGG